MSGLAIMTQTFATPTATGNMDIDIVRELGLTQEKLIFDQRTKALTKPGVYTDERNVQFAKMTAAVRKSYESTLKDLQMSGISALKAQQLAFNASAMTREVQKEILETMFPSGSDAVAQQSSVKGSFPGLLDTPASKPARAPAKPRAKRATKKK